MKAVMCCGGKLEVTDIPDPEPRPGQVLINVSRAGICGSDVHLRDNLDANLDYISGLASSLGTDSMARGGTGVVFGHEICGEVVDYGADTHRRWKPGTRVVSMPTCRHGRVPQMIGVSPEAPGAYAEQMIVQEEVTFVVPSGLPAEHAVLTEPMSVAWHAVRRSQIERRQTAYVIGCGPVGMAVISLLKAAGVETVIASDMSPRRRELASRCGADVVIDPKVIDPFVAQPAPRATRFAGMTLPNKPWNSFGAVDEMNLEFDAMVKLRRYAMVPWWQLFRAMHRFDKKPSGPVVFDCVGGPGMLDRLVTDAPALSRIVVVGNCNQPDTFQPFAAQFKEMDIRYSVSYNPGEFRDVLHMIADGKVDPAPFLTGEVGLHGVEAAFDALDNPERHAKILIDPKSNVSSI